MCRAGEQTLGSAGCEGGEERGLEAGEVGDADGDAIEIVRHFAPLTRSEDARSARPGPTRAAPRTGSGRRRACAAGRCRRPCARRQHLARPDAGEADRATTACGPSGRCARPRRRVHPATPHRASARPGRRRRPTAGRRAGSTTSTQSDLAAARAAPRPRRCAGARRRCPRVAPPVDDPVGCVEPEDERGPVGVERPTPRARRDRAARRAWNSAAEPGSARPSRPPSRPSQRGAARYGFQASGTRPDGDRRPTPAPRRARRRRRCMPASSGVRSRLRRLHGPARGGDVLPHVLAAAAARHDVVDRVGVPAAVLAAVVVAGEHGAAADSAVRRWYGTLTT